MKEKHNNKSIFDSLFKISVIVLGIVYAALYYNQSLNGRYMVVDKNADEHMVPENYLTIFDTRTGISYSVYGANHLIVDYVKGIFRGEETKIK